MRYAETSSWTARIAAAQDTREVVALANEFMSGLDEAEIAFLPQRCRPRALANAEELSGYALELHLCLPMVRHDAEVAVRRIALVIGQCAHRLAILLAPPRYVTRPVAKDES